MNTAEKANRQAPVDVLTAAKQQVRQDREVLKAQDVLEKLRQRRAEVQAAVNEMVENGKSGTARAGDAELAAARGEPVTPPKDGADLLRELAGLDAALKVAESQTTSAMAAAAGRAVVAVLPEWRRLVGDVADSMTALAAALAAMLEFRNAAGLLRSQLMDVTPPVRPELLAFRADALRNELAGLDRQIERAQVPAEQ